MSDVDYREQVEALLDPAATEWLVDGRLLQHVSVILSDADDEPGRLPPVVCSLRPEAARELGFRLLVLAEHAERSEARR